MALTEGDIISIGAIIVGIISLILSYLLNRWTLKQSEKNLKTQLLYEDRKRAIFRLKEILKIKDYYTMKWSLIRYLDSPEGQFVLPDLRKFIINEIKETDKFIEEKGYAKEIEDLEKAMEELEEERNIEKRIMEEQDPFSRFDNRIKERFSFFKQKIEKKALEKLNRTTNDTSDII